MAWQYLALYASRVSFVKHSGALFQELDLSAKVVLSDA